MALVLHAHLDWHYWYSLWGWWPEEPSKLKVKVLPNQASNKQQTKSCNLWPSFHRVTYKTQILLTNSNQQHSPKLENISWPNILLKKFQKKSFEKERKAIARIFNLLWTNKHIPKSRSESPNFFFEIKSPLSVSQYEYLKSWTKEPE